MNIIEISDKYILNTYKRFPVVFVKGKGVFLFTETGDKMLDMGSGIAVSSLGHSNENIINDTTKQINSLVHTSNLYYSQPAALLAKRLVECSVFQKVFFCNSGAEANEGAIKLARKYGKSFSENKYKIISMKNSFHGRTITTLSATGQFKYQKGFDPLTPGFVFSEINNLEELKNNFNDEIAAVLIEPIQGEGGVRIIDIDYIKKCRELCDKYNALLIYDEIQTGVGRTGKLFAYEHFLPVEPDIITLAKGLAAGFPIGAVLIKDKFADFLKPGEHASTFGGNLVSAAAGNTVLNVIEKENLLENVRENGEYFKNKILLLKEKNKSIVDIRGLGYLIGIEFDFPAREMVEKLLDKNIITIPAGENVVRIIPPLVAKKEHFDIVINAIEIILNERK
jgi:acetylornithine/N-succinyldiaminopimelate aminotransferase